MPAHAHRALVLSHVPFEDLGSLEAPLRERGFDIETVDVATAVATVVATARFPRPQTDLHDLDLHDLDSCDLLIVLGGPIGVYDHQDYPFLKDEIAYIGKRLAAQKPTLGICLGAQLMAAALGARVYSGQDGPGQRGPEIGWSPLQAAGGQTKAENRHDTPTWFAPLLASGLSVFHWHGDTFDLPPGALPLAQTELYANQAFAIGDFALGLQFHPEVSAEGLERWYVGHACELRHAGIAPATLRASARKHAAALEEAAARFFKQWLDFVLVPHRRSLPAGDETGAPPSPRSCFCG
jgi:GMP synthase (glutamine-hydrolysing)